MWVTAELGLPTGVESPDTSRGTGTLGMCSSLLPLGALCDGLVGEWQLEGFSTVI